LFDARQAHHNFAVSVDDIAARISEELEDIGEDAPVAVLPEGPMTVPYLEHAPLRG
jgi:hypothetical protein